MRKGEANAHKDRGWEKFTDSGKDITPFVTSFDPGKPFGDVAVIQAINDQQSGVVFILWGGYAAKKGARINKVRHVVPFFCWAHLLLRGTLADTHTHTQKKHQVLQGPHPSPLSAHRGFFGCKHFSKANDYLVQSSKPPINWQDVGDAA